MCRFTVQGQQILQATSSSSELLASTVTDRSTTEERLYIVKVCLEGFVFFQLDGLTFTLNILVLQAKSSGHKLLLLFFNAGFSFIQAKKQKHMFSSDPVKYVTHNDHYYEVSETQQMAAVGSGATRLRSLMVK